MKRFLILFTALCFLGTLGVSDLWAQAQQQQKPAQAQESKPQAKSKVNINKANQEELAKLPDIGPKIAEEIIKYREKNGPFKNIEDIKKVSGIGEKKFEKLKDLITVE